MEEIKKIVQDYDKYMKSINESIEEIIDRYGQPQIVDRFSLTGIIDAINEELEELRIKYVETINDLHLQAANTLAEKKTKMIINNFNKASDYSLRINNALAFIEAEGQDLKDEDANIILEDFKDDYKTMKLFKSIIENKNGLFVTDSIDPTKTNYPLTFEKFNKKLNMENQINEIMTYIDDMFKTYYNEKLYNIKFKSGDVMGVRTQGFSIPSESYTIRTAKENILNCSYNWS